ncbi:MAG: flavodoxin domain-containing protein [Actinobacteria bacterium]|nr:flavodoxin domain-containing protein [Actinomycetota bacterium]MCG2817641.1 hypothetical protein [Actinomycetes bacterium]MBU4218911.1 flavodoxin domain-containing protein [Actinomycetota bacterium]MBU4358511.1 flavodoxin domain-containing protein [Actinomycetota bacterium]MBU4393095.1 flavodoxin domain-containing protein [Actinomycetota bacterium]
MKGTVVYYSKWGNCEQVAQAIERGLEESGQDVSLVEARSVQGLGGDLEFLVVGSPTRVGKMAGPVRKFIKREITGDWSGRPFAAFGTKMGSPGEKGKPESAYDINRALTEKGLEPVAGPFEATVSGMKGRLTEGALDLAFQFGKEVGEALRGQGLSV